MGRKKKIKKPEEPRKLDHKRENWKQRAEHRRQRKRDVAEVKAVVNSLVTSVIDTEEKNAELSQASAPCTHSSSPTAQENGPFGLEIDFRVDPIDEESQNIPTLSEPSTEAQQPLPQETSCTPSLLERHKLQQEEDEEPEEVVVNVEATTLRQPPRSSQVWYMDPQVLNDAKQRFSPHVTLEMEEELCVPANFNSPTNTDQQKKREVKQSRNPPTSDDGKAERAVCTFWNAHFTPAHDGGTSLRADCALKLFKGTQPEVTMSLREFLRCTAKSTTIPAHTRRAGSLRKVQRTLQVHTNNPSFHRLQLLRSQDGSYRAGDELLVGQFPPP